MKQLINATQVHEIVNSGQSICFERPQTVACVNIEGVVRVFVKENDEWFQVVWAAGR